MLLEGQNDREDKNLISDGCSTPHISASYLVCPAPKAAPSQQEYLFIKRNTLNNIS